MKMINMIQCFLYLSLYLDLGVQSSSNLTTINEDDDLGDDETWIDGVSRMDINNDVTCDEYEDGTCFQSSFKSIKKESNRKDSKTLGFKRTVTDLTKEFIVDSWRDSTPNMRVSIQFQVESGDSRHDKYDVRVSTDGLSLVVTKKSSEYMMDAKKALFQVLEERGIDEMSIQMIMKHHPRVIARKDSVSRIIKRNTHKRYVDQEFRIALPFQCRHKITSSEDGDEYFYGLHYTRYPGGEVYAHVELLAAISDSYSADRIAPMVTESMQVDLEEVEEEEATNFNNDAFVAESLSADRPSTGDDRYIYDHYSKAYTKVPAASNTESVKSNGSRSSTSKKLSANSPATRKSSSRSRKSLRSSSNNLSNVPPTVEIVKANEQELAGPTNETSIVSYGDGTFMTPDNYVNDNMSIDNSTIRTLDPYVYSSQEKNGDSKLTTSSVSNDKKKAARKSTGFAKSAKSTKSLRSTSRSIISIRSKRTQVTNDEDRSRSGRSNSSVSSASSDTPSRNNLTSLKVDLMKTVTPSYKEMFFTPKVKNLDKLKIPKELAPKIDDSIRLTRQKLKRLHENNSHSSDESHQRQSKKAQRT